jgi:hypothetical protein
MAMYKNFLHSTSRSPKSTKKVVQKIELCTFFLCFGNLTIHYTVVLDLFNDGIFWTKFACPRKIFRRFVLVTNYKKIVFFYIKCVSCLKFPYNYGRKLCSSKYRIKIG